MDIGIWLRDASRDAERFLESEDTDRGAAALLFFGRRLGEAADEIDRLRAIVADYEQMQIQHREHVRRLDIALNGDGAAKQASLIDLVAQFERR